MTSGRTPDYGHLTGVIYTKCKDRGPPPDIPLRNPRLTPSAYMIELYCQLPRTGRVVLGHVGLAHDLV